MDDELVVLKNLLQRMENGFEEVPAQSGCSEKLNRQRGRANERTQNLGELAAKKQIARQPGEQNTPGNRPVAAESGEKL